MQYIVGGLPIPKVVSINRNPCKNILFLEAL